MWFNTWLTSSQRSTLYCVAQLKTARLRGTVLIVHLPLACPACCAVQYVALH